MARSAGIQYCPVPYVFQVKIYCPKQFFGRVAKLRLRHWLMFPGRFLRTSLVLGGGQTFFHISDTFILYYTGT